MPTEIEKLLKPTGEELHPTTSVWGQLLTSFKSSKDYRHAFIEEKVRTKVAAQIKAIREQRTLKQPELSRKLGKSQSWVSRLEDPDQTPPTIPSLLKVAEAFDVDLEIRFRPFSQLLDELDIMTPESFEAPSFEDELRSGAFRHEVHETQFLFHTAASGFFVNAPHVRFCQNLYGTPREFTHQVFDLQTTNLAQLQPVKIATTDEGHTCQPMIN